GGATVVHGAGDLFLAAFAVDEKAVRRLADDTVLASHNRNAKEGLRGPLARRVLLCRSRMRIFEIHIDRAFQALAGCVLAGVFLRQTLATLADAPGQFGNIEKAIAVESHRGRTAVL